MRDGPFDGEPQSAAMIVGADALSWDDCSWLESSFADFE